MLKVRLVACVLMIVGVVGLFPTAVLDGAKDLGAVYVFGGIALCGFILMGASGLYQLFRIIYARLHKDPQDSKNQS